MAFVLLTMPLVLVTGYLEWQRRYQGAKTVLFLTKISCALVVLASLLILVIWRIVNPAVTDPGSADRLIYLGISLVMLAAAGTAGFLGGRLVFGARNTADGSAVRRLGKSLESAARTGTAAAPLHAVAGRRRYPNPRIVIWLQ